MDQRREQVGDGPQSAHGTLFPERPGSVKGPVGDVRLDQGRFELSRGQGADILHRAFGRLGDGQQIGHAAAAAPVAGPRPRWVADRVGDRAADGELRAADGAGADAEEANVLGGGAGGEQAQADRERGDEEQPARTGARLRHLALVRAQLA